MTLPEDEELVEVRLLELPLNLLAESQERGDELGREFSHIADSDSEGVPARLTALSQQLTGRYAESVRPAQEQIDAAIARGDDTIDVTFTVPRHASAAATQLWALLEEADEFCRAGDMLTLASTPEMLQLRHWYLGQFIDQLAGADPVSWTDFTKNPSA